MSDRDDHTPAGAGVEPGAALDALARARQAQAAGADEQRTAVRRELFAWGIAMALAVPVAAFVTHLFPSQDMAAPVATAGSYVLLSFVVAAALRRRVRPGGLRRRFWARSDRSVAVGGGIAWAITVVTVDLGGRHAVIYPIGMIAILAVWAVVAMRATPAAP